MIDEMNPIRYGSFMNEKSIITVQPGKRSGQPCIRGLRITVKDVLEYLASGMSTDEILTDFPDLTAEDIQACIEYDESRNRRANVIPAA